MTEATAGDGVWVSGALPQSNPSRPVVVKVWFDRQFLGDGSAYLRRAKEFSGSKRRELRERVVATLRDVSGTSFANAEQDLQALLEDGTIRDLQRHWVVNGFSCVTTAPGVDLLKSVPGVKKVFVTRERVSAPRGKRGANATPGLPNAEQAPFDPTRYQRPWYIRALQADRAWTQFGVAGDGVLNIIHDGNFVYPDNVAKRVYRNPDEVAGNGIDDDDNGLVDDQYGYNFQAGSSLLTTTPNASSAPSLHGTMCAAIICGTGADNSPYAFGVAPESRWAGVIAGSRLESAVEWAIEHEADTYSMSFSRPNLGELRSHWRKVMEHASFCGVYFVSGAGNFAQTRPVPVQMRVPEDIPNVVFAAAGVQRDLSRTPFSSKGPVEWQTEHYRDGTIQKPEVCAFNHGLPLLSPDGSVRPVAINGNSFAGPMFCGAIALMLSADPDLLPWDLKEIITSTAIDVGPPGVDYETGHGLINCFRAVKEVLRRKAVREGNDPTPFTGRADGDELDAAVYRRQFGSRRLAVGSVQANGGADRAGLKRGDLLIRVNDQAVTTLSEWRDMLADRGDESMALVIDRAGERHEFALPPGPLGLGRTGEVYEAAVFE